MTDILSDQFDVRNNEEEGFYDKQVDPQGRIEWCFCRKCKGGGLVRERRLFVPLGFSQDNANRFFAMGIGGGELMRFDNGNAASMSLISLMEAELISSPAIGKGLFDVAGVKKRFQSMHQQENIT